MPTIQVGYYVEWLIRNSGDYVGAPIKLIKAIIVTFQSNLYNILAFPPPWLFVLLSFICLWRFVSRRLAVFICLSFTLIWNLGLWPSTISTISLVIVSAIVSLIIAIPMGIAAAESKMLKNVVMPLLDALHTLPRFVFLIPAITLFGIGTTAAVFATTTLAVPPAARLTYLGLSHIDPEVIEAGIALGCGRYRILRKIKIPLAYPSIILGVNQCIMMCLVMVVIGALVGAGGLGNDIVEALYALKIGKGVEAGVAVGLVAIIIDRIIKQLTDQESSGTK